MAASTDILYFHGFKTWEAGDFVTVFRNEVSVGYIQVTADRIGELSYSWRLTFAGATDSKTGVSTREETEEAMVKAFLRRCKALGLEPCAGNRLPELPDYAELILKELRERAKPIMGGKSETLIKASDRCLQYMQKFAQRMLDMLDTDARVTVSREAKAFIRELKAKEAEEAEKAAA